MIGVTTRAATMPYAIGGRSRHVRRTTNARRASWSITHAPSSQTAPRTIGRPLRHGKPATAWVATTASRDCPPPRATGVPVGTIGRPSVVVVASEYAGSTGRSRPRRAPSAMIAHRATPTTIARMSQPRRSGSSQDSTTGVRFATWSRAAARLSADRAALRSSSSRTSDGSGAGESAGPLTRTPSSSGSSSERRHGLVRPGARSSSVSGGRGGSSIPPASVGRPGRRVRTVRVCAENVNEGSAPSPW